MQIVYRAIDNSIHDTAALCEAHEQHIKEADNLYQEAENYFAHADISYRSEQLEAFVKFILYNYTLTPKETIDLP